MATTNKKNAESNDYSMQERIKALYELQKIDSKIDEINKVKGELPIEVADLEDEVAGLQTRIDNIQGEIDELNALLREAKEEIEQNKAMIVKYTEQQNNVRNNREFDAIGKEIEYQELQNQLCEKHIKEYNAALKVKKQLLEDAEAVKAERSVDLTAKREELEGIDAETAKDIEELRQEEEKAREVIDERLLVAYNRIRSNVRNGLAVVSVKRDACGGCFNRIPPQRQSEIRQGKKIIICEYCGRILVSFPDEE
jgi:predicted  nucleic acid-binding Zn-ribbon protein